jgi:hypothetical protein
MSGRDRDKDLDRELAFHIEQHAEDLIARGIAREEAQRRAKIEIGGLEQVREECRDVRPWRWLARLTGDVRYCVRGIRKSPSSAFGLIVTVAVCIAVNTAVFTVVDSLILPPPSVRPRGSPDLHDEPISEGGHHGPGRQCRRRLP